MRCHFFFFFGELNIEKCFLRFWERLHPPPLRLINSVSRKALSIFSAGPSAEEHVEVILRPLSQQRNAETKGEIEPTTKLNRKLSGLACTGSPSVFVNLCVLLVNL